MTSPSQESIRCDLVELARQLGEPALELAILGEGNVSARAANDTGDTFWVKASGSSLRTLQETDLSWVRLGAVLELLEHDSLSEAEVETALVSALVSGQADAPQTDANQKKPSVETFLHALCLSSRAGRGGASWVGHTHAVAVNRILCSVAGAEPFRRHIFPDAVVVCGPAPAVVPYVDPGFALAKAVQAELEQFADIYGGPPKLLLLENHGLVALGQSAREVLNITLMADKWARTLLGTYALGGPRFLPDSEVARIDGRLDEHYRRARLVE